MIQACQERGRSGEDDGGYGGYGEKTSGKTRDAGNQGRGAPESSKMEKDHCKPNPGSGTKGL